MHDIECDKHVHTGMRVKPKSCMQLSAILQTSSLPIQHSLGCSNCPEAIQYTDFLLLKGTSC